MTTGDLFSPISQSHQIKKHSMPFL